ncbi:hypothetical protein JL193_11155 [Polaribacter batillariae]|uniref:Uncharacterized protein n=1 Tax=Polaribacter batillariae TaxID=2808900 RepID=A0ABX7ST31_9FLAO|nr:hypothetical protein [Polaribacter batillariae]QTD36696.1 hypothetical protein JL193_11155 [Polaribacter batillariae]
MIQKKILIGIIAGLLVGMFVTSVIVTNTNNLLELFLTKITATSIITGVFCGAYAYTSKSKLQVFFVSIIIGIVLFYLKYLVTGHDFDALTMGAFVGAMLGGVFAIISKILDSYYIYKRLQKRRKKGFGNYR